eukprot:gene10586-12246_t
MYERNDLRILQGAGLNYPAHRRHSRLVGPACKVVDLALSLMWSSCSSITTRLRTGEGSDHTADLAPDRSRQGTHRVRVLDAVAQGPPMARSGQVRQVIHLRGGDAKLPLPVVGRETSVGQENRTQGLSG